MKSICNEIFKFLGEISQKELRQNPRLRKEVKALLGRLEQMRSRQEKPKSSEMVKYLDKEMFDTK